MVRYRYAQKKRSTGRRHAAYEDLMTDIFVDAILVAAAKRKPLPTSHDSPQKAREFLQSEKGARWAELMGFNLQTINTRLDNDIATSRKKSG